MCVTYANNLLTENQTIYITLDDINDNEPSFAETSYVIDINEEIPIGGLAYDVTATDADIGNNARLTFTLDGSADSDHFYFDSIFVAKAGALKMLQVGVQAVERFVVYKYLEGFVVLSLSR